MEIIGESRLMSFMHNGSLKTKQFTLCVQLVFSPTTDNEGLADTIH